MVKFGPFYVRHGTKNLLPYDSVLGPLVLPKGLDRLKLDIVKAQGPPIKTCRNKSIKIMEAVVPPKLFSMGLSRLN